MVKKRDELNRPPGTAGAVLTGAIPGGWEVVRAVITHPRLCSRDDWEAMGRPVVCVRYGLGYRDDDLYGHTYCHTGCVPYREIAARVVTPSNCRSIEVGVVTHGGEVWAPAFIFATEDDAAAREFVRRRVGRDQPVCYWDYSLSVDNVARYQRADYTLSHEPVFPADEEAIERMADDGSPTAKGSSREETEGE